MTGYQYQSVLGAVAAAAICILSLRAFRRRKLSFSLLFAWITVAGIVGLTPILSWLLRTPAAKIGVTPTGIVLALATNLLLLTLFRLSVDVSSVRQIASSNTTQTAVLAVTPRRTPTSDVLVLIPALNEAGAIAAVVTEVLKAGFDCLVVDDGSTDNTFNVARDAGAMIASHSTNLGVGAALRTGFQFAYEQCYDVVVQCDGDGQHEVASIADLVARLRSLSADLVIGSRWLEGGQYSGSISGVRRKAMRTLSWYASRAVGGPITDPTSGFRAFSSRLATASRTEIGNHYLSDTFELLIRSARAGYAVEETSVSMRGRVAGVPSAAGVRLSLYAVRAFLVAVLHLAPPFGGRSPSVREEQGASDQ